MIPSPRLEPDNTVLVFSTRTANLDMLLLPIQDTSAPVLLLSGPTEQDSRAAEKLAQDLRRLRPNKGPAVYLIRWKSHWTPQGQTRFAPLVRDLREILNHLTKTAGAPHLITLGHGALVLLRIKGNGEVTEPVLSLASLSFLHPRLDVQGRKPRLQYTPISKPVSLIGTENDMRITAPSLIKRVSRNPVELFEIENEHWFVRSRVSVDPSSITEPSPRGYAGNWLRSWLDWLPKNCDPR